MELTNDFEVKVPIDEAWKILTDIERIAPCMPGAQLQEVEGDEYRGVVKVKVGPITAQYKGTATFVEQNEDEHVAVLKADGRDTRGQGNANALITARLSESGDSTKVSVHTDLTVTGKVAQFGRGVMADVSAKLLDQFVENLETMVLADTADTADETEKADDTAKADSAKADSAEKVDEAEKADSADKASNAEHVAEAQEEETTPAAVKSPDDKSGVRQIHQPDAEPVDLLGTAGAPVVKRVVPAIAVLVVLFFVWRWLRGRDD